MFPDEKQDHGDSSGPNLTAKRSPGFQLDENWGVWTS